MIQSYPLKICAIAAGWLSLSLGVIGIFLPLLPTTPFILLAAYCFSKSSQRLHHWLLQQPQLGPMIQNWEQHGSISKRAKFAATVAISLVFSITLVVLTVGVALKGVLVGIASGVLCFIWTRPLPPDETSVEAHARVVV